MIEKEKFDSKFEKTLPAIEALDKELGQDIVKEHLRVCHLPDIDGTALLEVYNCKTGAMTDIFIKKNGYQIDYFTAYEQENAETENVENIDDLRSFIAKILA